MCYVKYAELQEAHAVVEFFKLSASSRVKQRSEVREGGNRVEAKLSLRD